MRNAIKILEGKPEGKRRLVKHKAELTDSIE
jgi:hypothetical protein